MAGIPGDPLLVKDSRADFLKFAEDIQIAKMQGPEEGDDIPFVEAPRHVIENYNRGRMADFDKIGYWIFQDCRICETGKSGEVRGKIQAGFQQ